MGSLNSLNKFDTAYANMKTKLEASAFFTKVNPLYRAEAASHNRKHPHLFKFDITHRFIIGETAYALEKSDKFTIEELQFASSFITYCMVEYGAEVSMVLSKESTVMTFVVREFNSKVAVRTKDELIYERNLLNNYVEFAAPSWNR